MYKSSASYSHNSSSHSSPNHPLILSPKKPDQKCVNTNAHPLESLPAENVDKEKTQTNTKTLLSMAVDKILSKQEEESINIMEGFMIKGKGDQHASTPITNTNTPQMTSSNNNNNNNNPFIISSLNNTPTVIKLPLVSSSLNSPIITPSPINLDRELLPPRLSLMQRTPSTILNPLPLPPPKVSESIQPTLSSCGYRECAVCLNGTPPGFNNSPYPTWADICYTALYVLTANFPEQKYFHIKKDICKFIDAHFEVLCLRERTSIWKQTVNMTLSHPQYFKMFQQESALENGRKGYYSLKFLRDPYSVEKKPKKFRKRKSSDNYALSSDIDEHEFQHNSMQDNQNPSPLSTNPNSPNSHSTSSTPRLNNNEHAMSPWFRTRGYVANNEHYNTRSQSRAQTEFNEQGERKNVDMTYPKSNAVDVPRAINPLLKPLNQYSESEINKDTTKPSAFSPFGGKRDREKMQALEEEVFLFLASKLNREDDDDENEVETEIVRSDNLMRNNNCRDLAPIQQLSESNEDFDSLKIDEEEEEDSDDSSNSNNSPTLPQQISPSWGMSNMSLHPKNYGFYNNNNNTYPLSAMPSPLLYNPQFRSSSSPPQSKWVENRANLGQETFLAGPPKRARKTTKPDEKTILEEYYLEHNGKSRHTRSELESLANRIHWKISRIQRWLDNRRTKEKLLNLTKASKKKGQGQNTSPGRQITFEPLDQKSNTPNQTIPHQLYPPNTFTDKFNRLPPSTTQNIHPFVPHISDKLPEKTISKIITYPMYSITTVPQMRSFENSSVWPSYKIPFHLNNNDALYSNLPLNTNTIINTTTATTPIITTTATNNNPSENNTRKDNQAQPPSL